MLTIKTPRIMRRMLRLWRMYRFVRQVNKKIDEENTDDFYKGINDGRFVTEVDVDKCLSDFKLWARNRSYRAKKICSSARKSEYIRISYDSVRITEKGERLIEGFGWGLFREFVVQEWKFLLIAASIIGFIYNPFSDEIKAFIMRIV